MSGGGKCCAMCNVVKLVAGLGALNWGLLALFQIDLVEKALGMGTGAAKAAYVVIGVAGLLALLSFAKLCPCQRSGGCAK